MLHSEHFNRNSILCERHTHNLCSLTMWADGVPFASQCHQVAVHFIYYQRLKRKLSAENRASLSLHGPSG